MEAVLFRKELFLIYAYVIELIVLGIMLYHLRITKKQIYASTEIQHLTILSVGWVASSLLSQLFFTPTNQVFFFYLQAFFWIQVGYYVMRVATSLSKKAPTRFWKIWKNIGILTLLVTFLLHYNKPSLMFSLLGPSPIMTSSKILLFLFLVIPAIHTFYFLISQNYRNEDQANKLLFDRTISSYSGVLFFGLLLDCVIPSIHDIKMANFLSFTSMFIGVLIILFSLNFKALFFWTKNLKYVFHHLIYNLNDGIIFINQKGKIILANESAHDILNIPRNQLIFKSIQTVLPNVDPFSEVHNYPVFVENKKQNLFFTISIIKNDFPEDEFDYLLILTNTREQTLQKKQLDDLQRVFNEEKLEQQLILNDIKKIIQEKETYLRTLINHLPFRLWSKNNLGVYTIQNQIDVDYTGNKIGQSFEQKSSEEIRAENGEMIDFETSETNEKGVVHYFHNLFIPLFSSQGQNGIIGIAEDITEKKQLQLERDQLRERLFVSSKIEDLGNLAGGVAHDFNNILGAQIGFCELALETMPEDLPARLYIDEVLKASMRGKKTVQKLLGTLDNTKQQEPATEFIASLIIEEVTRLLNVSLPANIEIETKIEDDRAKIVGYAEAFHRIIFNLTTNAISAMKNKGGTLLLEMKKVELEHEVPLNYTSPIPAGSYLTIKVKDTGEGIPSNILQRIFNPFFTTKAPKEGLGLGLSTTLLLLKEANAYITIETIIGKGSTFTVYWPYTTSYKKEEPMSKILIIDDDAAINLMLKTTLSLGGFEVDTANNGLEAKKLYATKNYDVIITDIIMPEQDGFEVILELRRLGLSKRIIAISGGGRTSANDYLTTAQHFDVAAVFPKPIDRKALLEKVHEIINTAEKN